MKKKHLLISTALFAILFALALTVCDMGNNTKTDVTVNALNLTGMVTAPVKDTAPATAPINHAQYTGTIAWQTNSGGAVSSKFGTSDAVPWKWDSVSNRPVLWFE